MRVIVENPNRKEWNGKSGVIVKHDRRENKPYKGVKFEGVSHIVWFYQSELVEVK